jgi:hypothetical protein
LSFLEETIGESLTRILLNGISVVAALAVCAVQVVNGDIKTGTAFAFLTRESVEPGKVYVKVFQIFLLLGVPPIFMLVCTYAKKWSRTPA